MTTPWTAEELRRLEELERQEDPDKTYPQSQGYYDARRRLDEAIECHYENWDYDFDAALQIVEAKVLEYKAKVCPTCGVDCGEPWFEPDDPSVGIFGAFWINTCEEHGEFTTSTDGSQEFGED